VDKKEGLWKKIGNSKIIGKPEKILFNSPLGNDVVNPKYWHMDGILEQIKSNNKRLQKSHEGCTLLRNVDMLKWIETDRYPFPYPKYK
jgi:hypothetical protein